MAHEFKKENKETKKKTDILVCIVRRAFVFVSVHISLPLALIVV